MNGDGCMSLLKSRSYWFIPGTKNKVPTIDCRCFTGRSIQNPHGGLVLFFTLITLYLFVDCCDSFTTTIQGCFTCIATIVKSSWNVCMKAFGSKPQQTTTKHNKTQRRLNRVHYCWDFLYSPLWWIDVSHERMLLQQWILTHWPLGDVVVLQKCKKIPAWITNHTLSKVWDGITYPFINFNGCTVEV